MKMMTNTLSALAIAAALMMNLTACTNDDNIAATTEQPETVSQPTTVHVTVGAGIGDGSTRAAVVQEGTTRTLTFTTGDRLYVVEGIYSSNPVKYLAGYLDIVGTPAEGATSATFSGDLSVYLDDGTPSTYDFGDADPLTVDVPTALLVPADAPAGFDLGTIPFNDINEAKMIAADVNTLMASALYVLGGYNSSAKSFSLSARKPILNCTIGNLKNNTEYSVKLRVANNQSDYESGNYVIETTYDAMKVTSDGDGFARFAISGLKNISYGENIYDFYYVLQFIPTGSGATKTYVLGQKALGVKVYNVTKSYGTCQLTVSVQDDNGGVVSYGSCDAITVKIGDKVIYQTPANGVESFFSGQATISFLTEVVSNATLTVIGTKKTSSGTVTYSGTATGVTILYNQTTNVGTVNLVKQ